MAAEKELTDFGKRLHEAADTEGVSVTYLTQKYFKGPTLHNYAYGRRGVETLESIRRLMLIAKRLHVTFEWLVLGEGTMRRDGRDTTPAEEAILFARKAGCREDAIQNAWEANREKEKTWSVWEWTAAIRAEAVRLDAAGVLRPEVLEAHQRAISREGKRAQAVKRAAKAAREAEKKAAEAAAREAREAERKAKREAGNE